MRWFGAVGAVLGAFVVAGLIVAPSIIAARPFGDPRATIVQAALHTSSTPKPDPKLVREHFRLENGHGINFTPNARNYAARTNPTSPLLLFLPATRERPSNYQAFLSVARARGFHVLALDYWNDGKSVEMTCGTNAACYTEMQQNRLDGTDPNQFSAVDPQNSIVDRLTAAINYLDAADPRGGWARFATPQGIDWSDIVVAGHSQGGGESAYIAHIHRVLGVLMFSSPVDSDQGVDASWMGTPGATPASRMYGFDDTGDIFAARIRASWNDIGLSAFGKPQNVEFGHLGSSHELISTVHLGTAMQSHSWDITDETPRTPSGHPIFENVWKWMLDQVWSPKPIATS